MLGLEKTLEGISMDYFQRVKEFIDGEFEEADATEHLVHLDRAVHWVKELEDEPSEALLIAAYAHDADHAERWKDQEPEPDPDVRKIDFTDEDRLRKHQERGAEIVGEFLESIDAPQELVSDVKDLISRHEFGGDRLQDRLKDADSLSFLENNVDSFLERIGGPFRKQDVREKFDWMYDRITSEEAKDIARPWYEDGVRELENK